MPHGTSTQPATSLGLKRTRRRFSVRSRRGPTTGRRCPTLIAHWTGTLASTRVVACQFRGTLGTFVETRPFLSSWVTRLASASVNGMGEATGEGRRLVEGPDDAYPDIDRSNPGWHSAVGLGARTRTASCDEGGRRSGRFPCGSDPRRMGSSSPIRQRPWADSACVWANFVALRYSLPAFVRIEPRPDGDAYGRAGNASMGRPPGFNGDHMPIAAVFARMLARALTP